MSHHALDIHMWYVYICEIIIAFTTTLYSYTNDNHNMYNDDDDDDNNLINCGRKYV